MSRPSPQALTVTLTAAVAGVVVGACVWAAWITVQLTHLISALTTLVEALASQS